MKLSARNQLKGEVVSIKEGAVNAIVGIKIKGGEIINHLYGLCKESWL